MSYRQKVSWLLVYRERKNRERLLRKLDLADAFNYAYLGSQPPAKKGQTNKNASEFKRWKRNIINKLYPNRKKYTIWDKVDKTKKKLIFN
jgi:hypothetical protein